MLSSIIAIHEDEGWRYIRCRTCRKKDESGTISLTLFNDELQLLVDRFAYELCNKYENVPKILALIGKRFSFKVAIDEYNAKKLLPVNVLRLSNDPDIIESLIVSATLSKPENEATSTKLLAITPPAQNLKRASVEDPSSECSKTKRKLLDVQVVENSGSEC
nr:replication protein A 70 kDa DNA-binding subunit B [Tanacetum cinerariifolium]